MQNNLSQSDFQKIGGGFVPPDLIVRAGLFRVNDIDGAEKIGQKPKAGVSYAGVIFPVIHPITRDTREFCLRRDKPDIEQKSDGTFKQRRKYMFSPNARNSFYFPPDITSEHLQNEQLPVIFTEGNNKTLALHYLSTVEDANNPKFLAVGLSGVWNFRGVIAKTQDENGKRSNVKGLIPDFQLINWENRKVFIVFDVNVQTNADVKRARNELASELIQLGAKPVLVDLPDQYGDSINGIDDLLSLWARELGKEKAVEKGLDLLKTAKPFRLGLTFGELQQTELKPRVEVIRGLASGENGIINSVTNAGKSTLFRNLIVSLITQKPFPPFSVTTKPFRVVLIDAEDTLIYLRSDIEKMIKDFTEVEKRLVRENLMIFCDTSIGEDELQINNPKHFKMLVSAINEFKADIIFVDTISRSFYIANENDNAEVKEKVMKPLKRLAVLTDSAVLGAHHIGKAKLEEGQTREKAHSGRGASTFGDQSRVIYNLEKTANDEIILNCGKIKGEKIDDTVFKLDKDSRWFNKQDIVIQPTKTNYQILIESLELDREYSRAEIDTILAGKMGKSTITEKLAESIKKGDLLLIRKGFYCLNATNARPYNSQHSGIGDKANNNNDLGSTLPMPDAIYVGIGSIEDAEEIEL